MMNQGHVHGFAGRRDFLIGAERLELPSFENAEQLVMQLARRGLIEVDRLVQRAAAPAGSASTNAACMSPA